MIPAQKALKKEKDFSMRSLMKINTLRRMETKNLAEDDNSKNGDSHNGLSFFQSLKKRFFGPQAIK